MSLTVYHIEPVSSRESLQARFTHNNRDRHPSNADPIRSPLNQILIGPGSGADLGLMAAERIGQQKIRKDARWAVEMMLSASPEYYRPGDPGQAGKWEDDKLQAWLQAAEKWLNDNYGNNILSAILHLDETTPHIHALIMPIRDNGTLSYKAFFDGRQKLRTLQTSYADAMKPLGIERGRDGSRPTHNDIKDYYARVNDHKRLLKKVKSKPPEPVPSKFFGYSTEAVQTLVDNIRIQEHKKTEYVITCLSQEKERSCRIAAPLREQIKSLNNHIDELQQIQMNQDDKYQKLMNQHEIQQQETSAIQKRLIEAEKYQISLTNEVDYLVGLIRSINDEDTLNQAHQYVYEKYELPTARKEAASKWARDKLAEDYHERSNVSQDPHQETERYICQTHQLL